MKRALVFLLVCASAAAGEFDVPPIVTTGRYAEALGKAQQAALIQTGVQGTMDAMRSGIQRYGMTQVEKLGVARPLGVVLYCTKVYREKSISIPIAAGKRLQLQTDRAAITINF